MTLDHVKNCSLAKIAGNVGDLALVDDFVYPYRIFPDLRRPKVLKDASLDATDKNFRTEWRMSDVAVLPVASSTA